MPNKSLSAVAVWFVVATLMPRAVDAQTLDQLGNRASALGAFVAVADDASAVAWNPAALINGPLFNLSFDLNRSTDQPDEELLDAGGPAGRSSGWFLAAVTLPLGISYARIRETQLSPAAQPLPGRQDRQVAVRSLLMSQLGVTVLQSIGEGITVGATAKLIRGSFTSARAAFGSWDDGFDQVDAIEGEAKTTGDVDLGVMAGSGRARVGLVARNLVSPTFETAGDEWTLERHVRVGAAWGDRWPSPARLIVAVDADVTRVEGPTGERRDVAAGVERWFGGQSVALRGGFRASTLGDARPIVSAGASYAVRSGIYLDVYAAAGRDRDRRWGVAGRLSY
jgi:hypothetical protein